MICNLPNAWHAGWLFAPSGTGQGRMNFHSATFAVTNSIVASYDAGTHGNPAVAPSPVTQGWTETTGAGTSVGGDPLQVHDV